jgi:hypothetical protein
VQVFRLQRCCLEGVNTGPSWQAEVRSAWVGGGRRPSRAVCTADTAGEANCREGGLGSGGGSTRTAYSWGADQRSSALDTSRGFLVSGVGVVCIIVRGAVGGEAASCARSTARVSCLFCSPACRGQEVRPGERPAPERRIHSNVKKTTKLQKKKEKKTHILETLGTLAGYTNTSRCITKS